MTTRIDETAWPAAAESRFDQTLFDQVELADEAAPPTTAARGDGEPDEPRQRSAA